MESPTRAHATATKTRWAGRILSALAVLFLTWDGVIKLMTIAPVVEAFARLGYPVSLAVGIGAIQLACVAIYVIPRTSLLGAVLLTGYLVRAITRQAFAPRSPNAEAVPFNALTPR